jgi:two-component system, response regulator, stage 0 sporulation protein F
MSVSILVVDDEPDVAELFRQQFLRETRQGTCALHCATSGVDALDRLAGEIGPAFVAVLSDINMPGMDGLQLLDEIKQLFPLTGYACLLNPDVGQAVVSGLSGH